VSIVLGGATDDAVLLVLGPGQDVDG
jgi:hypothetical protein